MSTAVETPVSLTQKNDAMKCSALLAVFFYSCAAVAQQKADLLLKNGKIIDGTGNPWFYGDVAVANGKIVAVGNLGNWNAVTVLNADGLVIAPGFIDVHTHIEGEEAQNPLATNFVTDGVTTVVTGNCGFSKVDIAGYFDTMRMLKLSVNVAALIGHNDVRETVMGRANRAPDAAELAAMQQLVKQAMLDGAVGLSTGLIYTPGNFSSTPEIAALAGVAAQYNGIYATHMRNEGDSITYAIEEALAVAASARIPLEISHLKLSGQQNWGRSTAILELIRAAREQGIDVTIDQYPYTASSTNIQVMLPDALLADGRDSLLQRLSRKDVVDATVAYMLERLKRRTLEHYSYAVVAWYQPDTTLQGKSIEEVNLLWGRPHTAEQEALTILDMIRKGDAAMIYHGMGEADVKNIMQYPFNMIASDGGIRVFNEGAPHPRSYGTNARVLAKYVREEKLITLEEAVRRMTSLPAQKFRFTDRGLIRPGFAADIVVFDAATVTDRSDFRQPHQYSTGFRYVLVNGAITVQQDKHTGVRNGQVLYGPGKTR